MMQNQSKRTPRYLGETLSLLTEHQELQEKKDLLHFAAGIIAEYRRLVFQVCGEHRIKYGHYGERRGQLDTLLTIRGFRFMSDGSVFPPSIKGDDDDNRSL